MIKHRRPLLWIIFAFLLAPALSFAQQNVFVSSSCTLPFDSIKVTSHLGVDRFCKPIGSSPVNSSSAKQNVMKRQLLCKRPTYRHQFLRL